MGAGLHYGFAVMSTDTGHNASAGDLTWALNHPQRQIDWGYRAMHGSVVLSKKITQAYYSSKINYAYYSGMSRVPFVRIPLLKRCILYLAF